MERKSLLQSFAIDKDGRVRAVSEVARGLACECRCPACSEAVVARQGEVRGWHFAHVSGAECVAAGESALHLAAKQLLMDTRGFTVPEMRATFDTRLPSGQVSRGLAVEPGGWIDFDSVQKEVEYGGLRPDLLSTTGGRLLMVEIAVTHFVGPEKIDQIETLGVAALEI